MTNETIVLLVSLSKNDLKCINSISESHIISGKHGHLYYINGQQTSREIHTAIKTLKIAVLNTLLNASGASDE